MIALTVRSATKSPHAALRLLSLQTALRNMERLKPSAPFNVRQTLAGTSQPHPAAVAAKCCLSMVSKGIVDV